MARLLLWLWGLALLPVLLLSGLRLASTPAFSDLELRRLPPEAYGLDRIIWSHKVLAFVLEGAPAETLSEARFLQIELAPGREFGIGNRAFCQREIQHLVDVRSLLRPVLLVWPLLVCAWLSGALILRRQQRLARSLQPAAAAALALLLMLAPLGTARLQRELHQRCFAHNSYLFYTTDTLLRLYPQQYWRDCVLFVAGFALVAATALLAGSSACLRPLYRRESMPVSERSGLAQLS